MPPPDRPRLFLIDGYALIYRAFFAMIGRPLTTSRGENTSATWGIANFLLRLREQHRPPYAAWVHDAGSSGRLEVYPGYKATREKLEPDLQVAFDRSVERVSELLEAFGLRLVRVEGWEADDVIGTLAAMAAHQDLDTVIVSGDKDLYQLIGPRVALLNPGRGGPAAVDEQWVDETNATERLGVPPRQVVDYLAMVGDASDNVPGVKGVGDKTARQLLAEYGDLNTILERAGEVRGKRAREALLAQGEQARLSRELVTIRRDAPLALDLETFRVREPDQRRLAQLFADLEFHSLLPKLGPLAGAVPRGGTAAAVTASCSVVTDPAELAPMAAAVLEAGSAVVRVLAEGPEPVRQALIGALVVVGDRGWYLPFGHRAPQELGAGAPRNLPAPDDRALSSFAALLADPGVVKLGHDIKRDHLALTRAGLPTVGSAHDVMLADFLLDPGRRAYDLAVLALERLDLTVPTAAAVVGTGRQVRPLAELGPDEAAAWLGAECGAIQRLHDAQQPEVERLGLTDLYRDVELPLVDVLAAMERRGVVLDTERLAAVGRAFAEESAALERKIVEAAGTDFNLNSTPQLRHVLFEKLQLPVIKKTKTGPSTDADVLLQLAEMGFDVPQMLLDYRELAKLRSTYVEALPARRNPETGRVHTTFNQTGAATGRLSSSDPNLQNIPVRTKRGEEIRRCFVAAPGLRLVVADYSQIELRVLAHLSEDDAFLAAFRRGGDIHRETAAIIFDVAPEAVTPEMRGRAKTINFATIYGQGAFSLSRQLGLSQDEARAFIETYFQRFAGVRRFLDATVERARERGFVETLLGRRRYIPELQDRNRATRAFGERTAMNSPMQGSAADLIKVAMVRLARALGEGRFEAGLLLQVHDELVLEAPDGELEAVCRLLKDHMEGAVELRVPLVADVGVGDNWVDARH